LSYPKYRAAGIIVGADWDAFVTAMLNYGGATAIVGTNANLVGRENYFLADGVADEVTINFAIAYVNALGGGSILIQQGTYTLAAPIVPTTGLLIFGEGVDTVLDGGLITHVFDINGITDTHIGHLSCQTTAGGGSLFNPFNIRGGSSNIHIWHVSFLGSDNDGIAITIADSVIHITDVHFEAIDNYPINCDGNDCNIRDNIFLGAIGNDGIFLDVNSDGNMVINNTIQSWTGEPIDDDGDNTVDGNLCCAAGIPAIAWNSKGCGFETIQAAIDHQITNGCIEILDGTHTVAGGVITLAVANTGLEIKGAGKLVTTLSSSTRNCIQLTAVANVVIRDLAFQTTGAGPLADGVAIIGACTAIFVIDCACIDSDQDAISIGAAASECFIRRNFLSNNIDRYGINNAGNDCIISGNRIINTASDGIWLQAGGTNNIVMGNRISGWVGEAIDNDEPTNDVSHNITAV